MRKSLRAASPSGPDGAADLTRMAVIAPCLTRTLTRHSRCASATLPAAAGRVAVGPPPPAAAASQDGPY